MKILENDRKVAVFIDNSNVYKHLVRLNRIDRNWIKTYNPKHLAEILAGNRELTSVFFYCSPPPKFMLKSNTLKERNYLRQISYYQAIKKLPKLYVKYRRLTGNKDYLQEKNFDTQLTSDMIKLPAEDQYDTAILVSNDEDYESAVWTVNSFKKEVELVYFKKYVSMALKSICRISRRVRQSFFKKLVFTNIKNCCIT